MIFLERSPLATAVATSAMLRTWPVRLEAIELTLSVRSFHVPATPGTSRLAAELALGADLARHAAHFAGEAVELIDHRVDRCSSARRISPRTSTVIFCERSPFATAVVTSAMLRTCAVRLVAIALTESVRSFHVPATPRHLGLPAELAFGADFARHARDFRGEAVELIDHRVDGVLQLAKFRPSHRR